MHRFGEILIKFVLTNRGKGVVRVPKNDFGLVKTQQIIFLRVFHYFEKGFDSFLVSRMGWGVNLPL
jgi:hypothetical protein